MRPIKLSTDAPRSALRSADRRIVRTVWRADLLAAHQWLSPFDTKRPIDKRKHRRYRARDCARAIQLIARDLIDWDN